MVERYSEELRLLDSEAGQHLYASMTDKSRCEDVLAHFEPQAGRMWCAVASTLVMLRVLLKEHHPARTLTQNELFNKVGRRVGAKGGDIPSGVSVNQLVSALEYLTDELELPTLEVRREPDYEGVRRNPTNSQQEITELAGSLLRDLLEPSSSKNVILVNMYRCLEGKFEGHWSLIGGCAVDAESGVSWILLLDVASHKIAHHWLPVEILAACMLTTNARNQLRGYLHICCDRDAESILTPDHKTEEEVSKSKYDERGSSTSIMAVLG